MLLLAGTSEAGKSSAGEYLEFLGARRIKIRTVLLRLASGREVRHEGVATREGFDTREFISQVLLLRDETDHRALVIESFIDASLAEALKHAWPGSCAVIFITAPFDLRVCRLAAAQQLSLAESSEVVRRKDGHKHVTEQLARWRELADHWIDNTGDVAAFKARLRMIFDSYPSRAGGAQP